MPPFSRAPTALLRFRLPLSISLSQRQPYSTTSPSSGPAQHTILNQGPANTPPHTSQPLPPTVSETNATEVSAGGVRDAPMVESTEDAENMRMMQAPNRKGVWSRSQAERASAMVGPRFEQTLMEYQPQPLAAIELIHKQPVRWTDSRIVSCDGGGGPLGHPRIFINVDKPQINCCTYCGLPFAYTHHKKYLESLPSTSYPLRPLNDPAEVEEVQRVSDEAYGQR